MKAYEDMIRAHGHRSMRRGTWCRPTTNGSRAWWWRRAVIDALDSLELRYPKVSAAQMRALKAAGRKELKGWLPCRGGGYNASYPCPRFNCGVNRHADPRLDPSPRGDFS